ncbi:MAG: hypothetical protein Q4C77_18090 [Eubacteriales bacterium]|nr:hypothetical protein [Eubacteriales bacterium]
MKAVYYISNSRTWGHVATQVWDILKQEGFCGSIQEDWSGKPYEK